MIIWGQSKCQSTCSFDVLMSFAEMEVVQISGWTISRNVPELH